MKFIHVILPLKLEWTPSYCTRHSVSPGQIVRVSFANRSYLGVVWHCDIQPELDEEKIQEILGVEERLPRISEEELKLWEFISSYYLCSIGEVFKAAYPGRKLHSEQSAVSEQERLEKKLKSIELNLEKKHCERVRLRLEKERAELISSLKSAGTNPRDKAAKAKAGKTTLLIGEKRIEEYIQALKATVAEGGQALIMCPEKAFCEKMATALEKEFPDLIHLAHSEQSPSKMRATAEALRQSECAIVIGARSSIFLPFGNLSLLIVDEEQDISFKQSEPAPRYNGRDCAIYLASLHSAQVMLGSACPSLESLHNSISGKYESRYCGRSSSECEIIDIVAEKRKNGMVGAFSRKAIKAISEHNGELILLRGWEKEEELRAAASDLFPDREIKICRLSELKQNGCKEDSILLVLQADALIDKDDFRSDERALQILSLLRSICSKLLVQTALSQRFNPEKDMTSLLQERKDFSFPPFTRLIEKKQKRSGEVKERFFLKKNSGLSTEKKRIASSLEAWCYLDVDPQ